MKALITLICFFIPFPSIRRHVRQWLRSKMLPYSNAYSRFLLRRYASNKDVVLWFDHSLRGGTEIYSMRQFKERRQKKQKIIRIQYFPAYQYFVLSAHTKFGKVRFFARDIDILHDAIKNMNICEIVVNNLVGYNTSLDLLEYVARLKREMPSKPFVSFRGHDFHAICPGYNLMNCDGVFCNLKYKDGCEECWRKKCMMLKSAEEALIFKGVKSISDWRAGWGKFFTETLDEFIVFSDCIRDIFIQIYPQLESKTVVIPHSTRKLRQVSVAPHNKINIACLGMLNLAKGRNVIFDMCKSITEEDNINIIVIGKLSDYTGPLPKYLNVTGQYKPQDLPDIIEKNDIDLVFISSVWPETFSYTASEAMSMGIPVACYNMGAPAERVGKYSHGLVLSEINPKKNLQEIVTFIKQKRKDA